MVRVGVIDKNGQDRTSKTRQSKMQDKTQDKTRQDTARHSEDLIGNKSESKTGTKTKSRS